MRHRHAGQLRPSRLTRAEAYRSLEMLDRQCALTRIQPLKSAEAPSVGAARIKYRRTVGNRDRGIDVLVEIAQSVCDESERDCIVSTQKERPTREINADAAIARAIFDPADRIKYGMTIGRTGERRRKPGIALDRLLQQGNRTDRVIPQIRGNVRQRPQIQVI